MNSSETAFQQRDSITNEWTELKPKRPLDIHLLKQQFKGKKKVYLRKLYHDKLVEIRIKPRVIATTIGTSNEDSE